MSSRLRDRRQKRRSAGVLRRTPSAERPEVQHSIRTEGFNSWRLVSFVIILCLLGVLFLFFSADAFYVRGVSVSGAGYLTREEIFAFSEIANTHVFWISDEQVHENLLRSPSIADAQVIISWPPQMVQIVVEEREPALIWEQGGTTVWVDLQGRVMAQRIERNDLVRIVAEAGSLGDDFTPDEALAADIVSGSIQLYDLLQVPILRYHRTKGLGIRNANGWDVWFGVGSQMRDKVLIYNAMLVNLQSRGIQAGEVNVVDIDSPYYTVIFGR